VAVKYTGKPLSLRIGTSHVVELPPRLIRVRLFGLMFETDKTFLLPDAMAGLRGLVDLYSDHEDLSVVITGHTDRTGSPTYNLDLSDGRAQSVGQFLYDDAAAWLRNYDAPAAGSAWGAREDQHMLAAVTDDAGAPFYEGEVDGIFGEQSRDAARRYQAARGLSVDGVPGPQTRSALIADYMALDGTSLPAAADVQFLGCGENHNAVATADGVEEEENRRVEIFLFDPGPPQPAVPDRCAEGSCAYLAWFGRTVETYDFGRGLGTLTVHCLDEDGDAIEGARVEVVRKTETERTGDSDADGRSRFEDLLPGAYILRATGRGYISEDEPVVVAEGDTFASLTLQVDWSRFAFELRPASSGADHEDE
jgi:outer membrane protein OmpA-like peptidoglycan-associated protein